MSLFPNKLVPGATLTIHLRWHAERPKWVHKRVFIVDPAGRRECILDLLGPSLPPPSTPEDVAVVRSAGEPFQSTPLLMAAHYLQHGQSNVRAFAHALQGLRDSTHFYTTFALPIDAAPGRWRVEVEAACEGEVRGSGTSATDYFLVEHLSLISSVASGEGGDVWIGTVHNPSPEPVEAQICELDAGGEATTRLLSLPPRQATPLTFRGAAFLAYAGGTEFLSLGPPDDPICLRNQLFVALAKPDGSLYVFAPEAGRERGYELTGAAAEIWRRADGFHARSGIMTADNAATYRNLVAKELIREVSLRKP